jgi:hypothetical protein
VARFGPDIALPDLLVALSSCERRADFSRPSNGEGSAWAATGTEAAVTKLRKPMNDLAAAICNHHGAARAKILGENRQRLIGWHFG